MHVTCIEGFHAHSLRDIEIVPTGSTVDKVVNVCMNMGWTCKYPASKTWRGGIKTCMVTH